MVTVEPSLAGVAGAGAGVGVVPPDVGAAGVPAFEAAGFPTTVAEAVGDPPDRVAGAPAPVQAERVRDRPAASAVPRERGPRKVTDRD
jgi:hypothetical protein